ncbi:hypothetical protein V6B16_10640 [Salinimicrobium catena]|uniref:hypothetical protein n=1 Tax=Salinimicrobium catena TaxID=390640 RepID=UPI002FE4C9A1
MPENFPHITRSAVIGAVLALFLLAVDLFLLREPGAGIQKMLPVSLAVVPAGAVGGMLYAYFNRISFKNTRAAILINFFSVLLYIFLVLTGFMVGMELGS